MPDFGLEISPRPDLPAIVARWQREIIMSELQAGYSAILNAADSLHCWRWLLDLRRRENLASPELTTWVNTSFFPQLINRYAEPVRIAFLISPMRASQEQHIDSLALSGTNPHPGHAHQIALFTDEAAAFHWLAS